MKKFIQIKIQNFKNKNKILNSIIYKNQQSMVTKYIINKTNIIQIQIEL